MRNLTRLSENLWVAGVSQKVIGFEFGTRMTVMRLAGGELLLHSPVAIDEGLGAELESLGEVKYIVAPNRFHHLHIDVCSVYFPGAELWAAPGLPEKRKDLEFDGVIDSLTTFGGGSQVEHFLFEGMPLLNEVVFYHPASKTLIVSDLLFNFPKDLSLKFRLLLKLFGIYGKPNLSFLERKVLLRDKDKARESAKRVLSLDFDRVVLAHRDIIPTGGREIVAEVFKCFGL